MARKICELKWDRRVSIGDIYHTVMVGSQMFARILETKNGKFIITMFIHHHYDIGDSLDDEIRKTYDSLDKAKSAIEMICNEELNKISEPI